MGTIEALRELASDVANETDPGLRAAYAHTLYQECKRVELEAFYSKNPDLAVLHAVRRALEAI